MNNNELPLMGGLLNGPVFLSDDKIASCKTFREAVCLAWDERRSKGLTRDRLAELRDLRLREIAVLFYNMLRFVMRYGDPERQHKTSGIDPASWPIFSAGLSRSDHDLPERGRSAICFSTGNTFEAVTTPPASSTTIPRRPASACATARNSPCSDES